MVSKFTFGKPFATQAVMKSFPLSNILPDNLDVSRDKKSFKAPLGVDDIIYGLGESVRGINKRGFRYISNCTDDFRHTEDKSSLYAAHNFFVVDGEERYGIFIDFSGKIEFDFGFTNLNELAVYIDESNYDMYYIEGDSVLDIIRQFREIIGQSYIAPRWAFGYQQSRWSYGSADEVREVVKGHRDNHIPLEAVYLDIDYMDNYKDFTVDDENFPEFDKFVDEMKKDNIHLVPIIDAAIKKEEGYSVYDEGVKNNCFCKDADGNDFVAAVWPGKSVLPDFMNPKVRDWFGLKYKFFTEKGIDGFWNDMNEPALFYSEKNFNRTMDRIKEIAQKKDLSPDEFTEFTELVNSLSNNPEDYKSIYHNINGEMVRHDRIHNMYGYNMTRAASEMLRQLYTNRNLLLISRASYIGMHRYSGIWTGDNSSWWSHIELLMHQLPNINMCGFLYSGADIGGFNNDTTEDLMMRFLELALFTPLMRNHSAKGTREQELYRFKNIKSFRNLVTLRYGFIPYLYSEYLKAVKFNTLMFTPLALAFPNDPNVRHLEDQLLVGENIMIAPMYKQNATGRYVYLPEDMTMIRFRSLEDRDVVTLKAGHHYIYVALHEVLVFVRKGKMFFTGKGAETTADLDNNEYTFYCENGLEGSYELYTEIYKSEIIKNN